MRPPPPRCPRLARHPSPSTASRHAPIVAVTAGDAHRLLTPAEVDTRQRRAEQRRRCPYPCRHVLTSPVPRGVATGTRQLVSDRDRLRWDVADHGRARGVYDDWQDSRYGEVARPAGAG